MTAEQLTDSELELHIADTGRLMQAAYARYEASSDLQDRAEADRWLMLQEAAIRARRPAFVASLEMARGLGGTVA